MIRINLLPVRELKAEVARRQELTIGVMCLVLTGIVMGAFHIIQSSRLSSNEEELAALSNEIKALNSQAKGVTNLKKNIGVLKQKLKVIDELGKQKTGPAKVMESLSAAMPPRLWITEFKESGGNLSISGMAVDNQTIAGFLKALSASPYFQGVELGETTQIDKKKLIITFLLVGAFLLRTEGWSQEVPGSTKKDISALKETAKSKLKSLGGGRSAEVAEDPLAMPSASPQMPEGTNGRRYSSAGKRDPFRPFVLELRPIRRRRENLSPLERVEVSQLKLVGIIWDIPEPRAMVEDSAGLGYVIKIGTPIGRNDGTVKVIAPKEVLIEENFFDFYGAKKSREVKLKLVNE